MLQLLQRRQLIRLDTGTIYNGLFTASVFDSDCCVHNFGKPRRLIFSRNLG
jgi:hypothetical protein